MKKRYIFFGGIVAVAAAAYFLTPSMETIVKKIVHKYGSEVTGTDVNLGGFNLSLKNGEASLSNITIANPKNYKSPYIFNLGNISAKVDIKSLTKDVIIVENVTIDKPVITYEMLSLTQNNVAEIQNNVSKYGKSDKTAETQDEPKEEKAADAKAEGGKKVVIKELSVNNGAIEVMANINGKENNLSVPLPNIKINNIGETSNGKDAGTSVATAISKVLNTVLGVASKTVVENQLSDLRNIANDNLDQVVGGVKDRVKNLGIFGK